MADNIKIITQHWNEIDPLKIEDYLDIGGYKALEKYVKKMNSRSAIEEIIESGLCGRGGAGFPTGKKMEMVAEKSGKKYFICNLDESEPGTYKDKSIIDNNPHLLLEGIIISSLIVGSIKSFIYINGNYEKQREILELAIEQAKNKNFLGHRILGSDNFLEIEIYSGAGAYICGEETALINSIEGNRGETLHRPPYPTDSGLFGCPTVINNAETITNIPWIISNGGGKYADLGGTKLYILSGAINKKGVIEGGLNKTTREIIDELGGGVKEGKEFWFAQIGGASGKLVTENELDIILSYDKNAPISLGSGAIMVIDKTIDIKDLLLSWTTFFRRESCGKCIPCREGTFRLWEIAKRMQDGQISDRDKKVVEDILWTLKFTTSCPLGKFAGTAISDAISKNIWK
ncbi:MAG TPA: NADH-ubiquinone oxidoreductase-F iron-sulfur binding region domain-containing protein [Patescibacteria group bacterium]|nr:NADH-ubiquinone oxidoreductase-F iron-sulfur binding region domain-containing protein [Patescibacteria group bacterium]